ncbi:MAG: hypothetical protein U0V18_03740 [Anaerolineales bacterium]
MKTFTEMQFRVLYTRAFLLLIAGILLFPLWQSDLTFKTIATNFRGKVFLSGYFNQTRILLGDRYFDSVIVGKEGWLYFVGGDGKAAFWDGNKFKTEKIDTVATDISDFNQKLLSMGTRLLIVIAPDKSTIYPQYLPDEIQFSENPTYTDLLVERLKSKNVHVLDLRETLIKLVDEEQVFYKTDSHWNISGDYAAYKAVIDEISIYEPTLMPTPFSDLKIVSIGSITRDIPKVLRINNIMEESFLLQPKKNKDLKVDAVPLDSGRNFLFAKNSGTDQPTVLIYHDSFFTHVVPLMQQNFHQTLSMFYPATLPEVWNSGWVDQFQPAYVIIEFTERVLPVADWPIYR